MKLNRVILKKDELKEYDIYKEQLVLKNKEKKPELKWLLETYTNYMNIYVYHYIEEELIKVEIYDLEKSDVI